MNFTDEYRKKLKTPDEAVKIVKSGDWIDFSANLGCPYLLDIALAKRKDELEDVKIRGHMMYGPIQCIEQDPTREHFSYNSWHMIAYERKLCDRGLCSFSPMIYRNLPSYYREYLEVNVAMMQVTPMDEHGFFGFSSNNACARATMDAADYIILEVNEYLPYIRGMEECIHISEIDAVVEGEHPPLNEFQPSVPGELEMEIAKRIVEQMSDGSVIQLGVGGLPDAIGKVIAEESDLKDLGIHSELLVNSYLDMYKAGKVTNKYKTVMPGKSTFAAVYGTKELMDWAADNPSMFICPIDFINGVDVVKSIDKFVSINNAINVDLYGQISSESSGLRQISGTGGQLDFITGAYDNPTGKSFIALTSTFTDKKGIKHSRIVPHFNGDIITDPRSQAGTIVTENGLINLTGKTVWERAEALISIADPEFRDELIRAAENQKIWRKTNKKM